MAGRWAAIYRGGAAWGAHQPSEHGAEADSLRRWSLGQRRLEVGEGPDKWAQGGSGTEHGAGQSEGERGKGCSSVAAGPVGMGRRQKAGKRGKEGRAAGWANRLNGPATEGADAGRGRGSWSMRGRAEEKKARPARPEEGRGEGKGFSFSFSILFSKPNSIMN